jgi:hypothetical protein
LVLVWEGIDVGFLFLFWVLTLVGCSGAVPEEGPLEGLATLELVFEAEGVVLVGELEEVCQRGLD